MLLDNAELISQLTNLQREVGKSGRDRVVRMRGFRDDLASTVMAAVVQVGLKRSNVYPVSANYFIGGNSSLTANTAMHFFCWHSRRT